VTDIGTHSFLARIFSIEFETIIESSSPPNRRKFLALRKKTPRRTSNGPVIATYKQEILPVTFLKENDIFRELVTMVNGHCHRLLPGSLRVVSQREWKF
jgi:hypothetical protein